jgi:hypothetical protein
MAFIFSRLPVGYGYTPGGVAAAYGMRSSVWEEEFERRVVEGSMTKVEVAKPALTDYDELKKLITAPLEEGTSTIYLKVREASNRSPTDPTA